MSLILSALSRLLGWAYTLVWSGSFYFQVVLNFRRKHVGGLSIDFVYLNVTGFLAYTIFNVALLTSPTIREEYWRRNGTEPLVQWNDFLFSFHAFVMSSISLIQTLWYPRAEGQQSTIVSRSVIIGTIILIPGIWEFGMSALDVVYLLSYVKLLVSIVKYIPQIILNHCFRSTTGWSIHNVLLDLAGGILSDAQLLVDASMTGNWKSSFGNPTKLGLGALSIFFDLVFILQHYILYPSSQEKQGVEQSPLLSTEGGVLSQRSARGDHL